MTFGVNHDLWLRQCGPAAIVLIFIAIASVARAGVGGENGGQMDAAGDHSPALTKPLIPSLIQDTVPASAFYMTGDQVTFMAIFSNAPAAIFQWQKISNGMALDIPGASNTTLTLNNLQLADTAAYRLKVVNATNGEAIGYTSSRPLVVDHRPAPVNNLITAAAAQTGLGGMTSFTPTWSITTNNSLIAGRLPGYTSGNFSLEAPGRDVGRLTDGNKGTLTLITNGLTRTFFLSSSTNYATCGSGFSTDGSRAGFMIMYSLPAATNGYDLTNITVYGGWANNGRDQQAYTVYYSTVAAPTMFVRLGSVNYNPPNPANVQSATRVTLLPAVGVLAANVSAIRFDFTSPASKNGYCGYSQIILEGVVSATLPPLKSPGDRKVPTGTEGIYTTSSLDFLGSWIWDTNTFDKQTCYFWKTFDLPPNKRASNARLIMSVDNEYTLFLDGQLIGRMDDWREYWEYDVTLLMTPGQHVLAVNAYNSAGYAGMIFGLHVDFEDGDILEIKSDPSWKVVPQGTRRWKTRNSALSAWRPATVVGELGSPPWNEELKVVNAGPPLQPVKIFFWQTPWFQIAFATLCGFFLLIIFFLAAQLALHQKERWLLQRERARIAMDIHDDIGSRITQLVLDGEAVQEELPENSKMRMQLKEIWGSARRVLSSIDEILWALNPRLDTLRDFADYICDYAQKFLEPSGVKCVFKVDPDLLLPADLPLRRSLLMAIKETLNNVVKHSGATELRLEIEQQHQHLVVVVQDNGKGFAPGSIKPGRNGLGNLSRRMGELGGSCHISSQPGNGCRIEFIIPLKRPTRFSFKRR
jgi:signal transduction histidine kinase